ncbi:hypothetical protein AVEN_101927-1 [Araneus ventricosus]|uniref:Uncharacterized protein n=1 Tax=Araneus ventricosus TaxID=182803 RepID=A0A4Y2D3X1_ARAVE|nr:hypothetical protein AVEN_240612-1 [Araneus ventricosus]GBM13085.1 hypothetical protein AVEN_101927-1 [Araneus ventricosus]
MTCNWLPSYWPIVYPHQLAWMKRKCFLVFGIEILSVQGLVPERPVGNTDNLYFVLDGGSLIHRVVWPKKEIFGDVYTTCMSYIKRHYGDEVTVVSDGYTESSVNTKVIERQRRRMKRTSR